MAIRQRIAVETHQYSQNDLLVPILLGKACLAEHIVLNLVETYHVKNPIEYQVVFVYEDVLYVGEECLCIFHLFPFIFSHTTTLVVCDLFFFFFTYIYKNSKKTLAYPKTGYAKELKHCLLIIYIFAKNRVTKSG